MHSWSTVESDTPKKIAARMSSSTTTNATTLTAEVTTTEATAKVRPLSGKTVCIQLTVNGHLETYWNLSDILKMMQF